MERISKQEWRETHRDFKSVINGVKHVMRFDEKIGSHLVPVELEKKIKKIIEGKN